jgi:hypothetical protein
MRWGKSTTRKMAQLALDKGMSHSDTKGRLNKWLSKLWFDYKTANNIRIYGQDVYLFKDNVLITLYRVPTALIKLLKKNA